MVLKASRINSSTFRSARLNTKGKREFQFGRIDIRAKLPEGQGLWPALWMLGANIDEVSWPACGEIDITELVGHEANKVHATAHWGASGGPSTFITETRAIQENFSENFHVFSILWKQNSMEWFLDEEKFHTITAQNVSPAAYPFNQKFFFVFNVAVGGNWPGNPDSTTEFPQEMEIDYVRVFQLKE